MSNAKDKAFHADGSMTAAEYKRRFLNKKAVARAQQQVDIRFAVTHSIGATKADKARLRNVHIRSEPMPGTFYSERNAKTVRDGSARTALTGNHIVGHAYKSL